MVRHRWHGVVALLAAWLLPAAMAGQGQDEKPVARIAETYLLAAAGTWTNEVAIAPDGQMVAYGHFLLAPRAKPEEVVTLWDIQREKATQVLKGHKDKIRALAFSEEGKTLTSISTGRPTDAIPGAVVMTWNVSSGALIKQTSLVGAGVVKALSGDGRVLLTLANDSRTVLQAWDLTNGKSISLEGHDTHVSGAVISANRTRIATIGAAPNLIVWEYPSGKKLWDRNLDGFKYSVLSLAFSPDGKTLVVANFDDSVFFDVATGKSTSQNVRISGSDRIAFSPNGKLIAYSSLGVGLWSPEKRAFLARLDASGNKGTRTPMFSLDGRFLVTNSGGGPIRIWELPKLEP